MALNSKNAETDPLPPEIDEPTGEKSIAVVKIAVQEWSSRKMRRRERGSLDRIRDIVQAYNAKPLLDPRTSQETLYDEDGLPQ
jgi:hypothetical protein